MRQYGREALAVDPEQFEEVRGRHSRYCGYFYLQHTRDFHKALHYFSVAQELARLQDSPWHEGMTLFALGRARRNLGYLEEADKLSVEGIALLETESVGPALAEAIGTRITNLSTDGPSPRGGVATR